VVGEAVALLFDPYNTKEITEAMYKVLTDKKMKNELIQKGFKCIKYFS